MTDKQLQIGWGCPSKYAREYTSRPEARPGAGFAKERRQVASAANWYPELDDALAAIVAAYDTEALAEWRDSDEWEDTAAGTCQYRPHPDDCTECAEYCAAVRDAFNRLIEAIPTRYTYTIRTDGVCREIVAEDADEAARLFAEDEFPRAYIDDVADLIAHVESIGGWVWIESTDADAPDGARQGSAA